VKEQVIGGQENQDIPFEQVVEMTRPARSLSHSPIFQTVFAWQGLGGELELEGVEVRPLRKAPITAKFDLTLTLWEREGGEIAGGVTYARSLYERGTIERWVGYYRMLLEGMGEDEDGIVDHLGIMSEREREQMLYEWNETEEESGKEKRIEEIFEEQARRQPDAVGVVHEGEALSYGELNRRANRLGHYLRRLGVRPDSRVAICMERGAEMVIGILAILKAGGAYVPLDPAYPRERLLYMLEDSEAVLVLTQSDMRAQVEQASGGVAVMEVGAGCAVEGMGERNLGRELRGSTVEDLAYVIYTSGSSGKPKGVMVPHRGVRRLVIEGGYAKFEAGDGVGFASNPAFDAATMEIWGALLNGGRVVVIGQDVLLDAKGLGEELKREGVSILWLTVGLFNQYVEELKEEFGGLRYLVVGGDALEIGAIRKVLEGRRPEHLLNGYGPTETTTFALTHEIREVGEQSSIPIGKPIGNTQVYILDGEGEPVPQGVRGELYIGGEGVARGYLKRAELTGERFLPDAYRGKYGERMYRTGDLGKWRKDGTVEFLGRNDDQVKVRGYRIELGEIEEVLRGVEGVGEVVVMARKDGAGNKYLAGYYTVESERGEGTGAEQLRAYVAAKLPEYMVPAAYVRMEKMPLTANGKLDRNSLPAPEGDAYALRQYQAPEGETEVGLAAIWAELLHIEKVGRHDNFFELGGHSLLAMQVISRVRKELGGAVTIYDVFAHPTLSLLADRIVTVQLEQFDPSEIGDLLKLVRSS
jgi:amino acid adenylation domain-containing protein